MEYEESHTIPCGRGCKYRMRVRSVKRKCECEKSLEKNDFITYHELMPDGSHY
jgi:hypothetical protein